MTDLPAEVRLALGDIAGVARDGLLAMSVAAGLAVMQAMFEAEISAACGPKGRHDPDRAATRHGAGQGSVVLGGRRVPVTRPALPTIVSDLKRIDTAWTQLQQQIDRDCG